MHCHYNGTLLTKILPPILIIEFILGFLGNGLALWIFFYLKPWKSSTVFLFNLALADFFLNVALPFRASYYISELNWHFGDVFCNIILFMLAMNRSGSIIFLTAVAVDRYVRVVHPHHSINSMSVSKAGCVALSLWLFTVSMTAHLLVLPRENTTQCESFMIHTEYSPSLSWHEEVFVFSFYLALAVILYCTFCILSRLRGRQLAQHPKIKKALWFITVVVVLFMVCFFPSNITQLLIWIKTREMENVTNSTIQVEKLDSKVCDALENLNTSFYITVGLTYLNSVLDPVVYYFSSPVFKAFFGKRLGLKQSENSITTEKKTRDAVSVSLSQL